MRLSKRLFVAGLGSVVSLAAFPVHADTYPDRPIKIIAPFPAGGLVDVLARALGDEMSKSMHQPIIIENKPGAGGNIGAEFVSKSAPDGYTLLMTSPGIQSINQFLYKSMPFDPENAFVPISMLADMSMVVVVHPKTGITTLKQLVDFAHEHPGKLNFGSAGVGTTGHLGLELLMHAGQMKFTHVPYKGAAPSITDLIAGQIDGVVDNPPTVLAHIRAGSIRALAVAGRDRLHVLPNVPTAAEAGLPAWEASSWFGLVAPAGTSKPVLNRLYSEVQNAVKSPRIQALADRGMQIIGSSPAEFAELILAERKKWGDIIKSANIAAQ
jgi:tripartite-type tricarboxylate transporter receptor subunit TctC